MSQILSVSNQKGGVGKTTTAINLGAALAKLGKKVLLVDFDHQANLTRGTFPHIYLENKKNISITAQNQMSIVRVLQKRLDDALNQKDSSTTSYEEDLKSILLNYKKSDISFDVLPASQLLANFEIYCRSFPNSHLFLKQILKDIKDQYDYIIIDCPPSLGSLTVNAWIASNSVLVPVSAGIFPLEGTLVLAQSLKEINSSFSTTIEICGFVTTGYLMTDLLHLGSRKTLLDSYGDKVFKTIIHKNNRLAEAAGPGEDILTYSPRSTGAHDYLELAKELIKKEGN